MTNEEMLHNAEVLTAKANGVECERLLKTDPDAKWRPWIGEVYDPVLWSYRKKPEPVVNEWWTNVYPEGSRSIYPTPEEARGSAGPRATETAVKVVRADSIRIAGLFTDEQIEKAQNRLVDERHIPPSTYLDTVIAALDKVREEG